MINIERQRELFIKIGEKIPRKMEVFAIGGTGMMLQGLKEQTVDVDLVFANKNDRELFKNVALSLGYKETDPKILYGRKPHTPIMFTVENARFDLFLLDVLGVRFSDSMIVRAEQTHQFYENLIIKPANFHDIIIMKSATGRAKDENDLVFLLKNKDLSWQILVDEAKNQVSLGNERAILELGQLLERLSNKGRAFVPKEVLDQLWGLLTKQMDEKNEEKDKNKEKLVRKSG